MQQEIKYSLPISHYAGSLADIETLLDDYEGRIHSIYMHIPGFPSARIDMDSSRSFFDGVLRVACQRGVSAILLVNSEWSEVLCERVENGSLFDTLQSAAQIADISVCSRSAIILNAPELAAFHKTLSVNAGIYTEQEVYRFSKFADFDAVCLDRNFNRNLDAIVRLRQGCLKDKTVSLLLNEGCLPNCPLKLDHRQLVTLAYESDRARQMMEARLRCWDYFNDNSELALQSPLIYREQLSAFTEAGVDYFKLVGRGLTCHVIRCLLDYYEGRGEMDIGYLLCARRKIGFYTHEISDSIKRFFLRCEQRCFACQQCDEQLASIYVQRGFPVRQGGEAMPSSV